ncbi:MAG: HEPN domain-containing protein [Bacteroidota bacterium]|nr:HEPN domain-containing protein [Bacteroidota bacterium]
MAAFDNFRSIMKRAETLVDLHKVLCPRGKPKAEYADILRAVIVLSVSAVDGYFHEKIPENIARLIQGKRGRNLPGKLIDVIKAEASHEKLISIMFEKRRLSHIVSLVRKSMKEKTYQDPGKIEEAIKLLGIDKFWEKVGQQLNVQKEKKIKTYIQRYINRRNDIAHRADFGQTKRNKNKLHNINRSYANKCIDEVRQFIEAIESVIETELKRINTRT